ncbi:MAG: hypothetical protein UZ21_OP11001000981 [Microgenomates bacterium OLB22]|nr:MAG: hypothetical protein UZ21_OP11001000981 [Microgenomates bacterium OLB22]
MSALFVISSAAAYAYFSDIAISSGNVLGAGTLDLKLSDEDEVISDSLTASFGGTLAPGECAKPSTIKVRNTGSIGGDHVDLLMSNVVNDAGKKANAAIDTLLEIREFAFDETSLLEHIDDINNNEAKDLDDLGSEGVKDLALTDNDIDHTISIKICLSPTAGDDIQGDTSTTSLTATLFQNED